MSKYCKHCSILNPDSAKFCRNCGKPFLDSVQPTPTPSPKPNPATNPTPNNDDDSDWWQGCLIFLILIGIAAVGAILAALGF